MRTAIIVAGGKGTRIGTEIPKQFIELQGVPMLVRAILPFINYVDFIVVALPSDYLDIGKAMVEKYFSQHKIFCTNGGETRTLSVYNSLKVLYDTLKINSDIHGVQVAIHDAARPFITSSFINTGFELSEKYKAAIPVLSIKDSLRRVRENENSVSVNRVYYKLVQTPQFFNFELLFTCYLKIPHFDFQDDASIFDHYGHVVELFDGLEDNIKITTPIDITLARFILEGFNN